MRATARRWSPRLCCLTAASLLGGYGCATTAQLRDQPLTAGSIQAFPRRFTEVRDAGCEAIRSYGWQIREVGTPNDTTWWALASRGTDIMTTWGTVARLVVFDSRSDTTVALVRSEEAAAANFNDRNEWAPKFFYRMGEIMTGQRPVRDNPCAVAGEARGSAG